MHKEDTARRPQAPPDMAGKLLAQQEKETRNNNLRQLFQLWPATAGNAKARMQVLAAYTKITGT